ncbi:MAG: DUF3467 domain-containing protein [Myxococcales bacterium]|nr:DUF3467 domain-containing protein [Myxococcales bacterium]
MIKDDNPESPAAPVKLQIQVDDDLANGVYSNLVMITHTETEFLVDFVFVQPQQPRAKVRSRVILSPKQAKRLLNALGQNLQNYENKFGPIEAPAPSPFGTPNVH